MSTTDARVAVFSRLVDDAALFPPASLAMRAALEGHARHRGGPHAWMVGRFLCPAVRLPELVDSLGARQEIELGVLCRGGRGELAVADLAQVRTAQRDSRVRVTGTEFGFGLVPDLGAALDAVLVAVVEAGLAEPVELAAEIGVAGRAATSTRSAVHAVAARASALPAEVRRVLVKVRCGGAEAAAFPTAGELTVAVVACASARVALKATAGLHHPHRRTDPVTSFEEHGFLNLVAAIAAAGDGAGESDVARILDVRSVDALRLGPDRLDLGDRGFDAAALAALRRDAYAGQGSCSIDEPVEDLTRLGVLPVAPR